LDPIGRSPIPTPLLVLGKVALVGSLSFFFLKERLSDSLLFNSELSGSVGAVLGAVGLLLVLPGLASLGRSAAVGLPEQETQLKTRGMYRFTRNPIYLGGFIACIGSCLFAPHVVNILLALTTIVIHHWIVTKEEVFLEQRFGEQWLDFKRRIPRYVGVIRWKTGAGNVAGQ
jgi:protein-S-isoprenylcysteine O-methyltransferase Ste14